MRGNLKSQSLCVLFLIMLILLLASPPVSSSESINDKTSEQGNPTKGWKAFYEKGCIKCHSVWGEGGNEGPDLAVSEDKRRDITESSLASSLWNHAPVMLEKIVLKEIKYEPVSKEEMSDIFSFLTFIRSTIEIGDPKKGASFFEEKKCSVCHSIKGKGGRVGPELSGWGKYTSPVVWADLMWNHAPAMKREMAKKGIKWPTFEKSDMADLVAYIKEVSGVSEKEYLSPGNAAEGEEIFRRKGCIACHSVYGKGGKAGPDLSKALSSGENGIITIMQIAGLMWNHSPLMISRGASISEGKLELTSDEMSHLVAYLLSLRRVETAGDAKMGAELFNTKKCSSCHVKGTGKIDGKISLPSDNNKISPIYMAWAMWNHGPKMRDEMKKKNIQWPLMEDSELADIAAFLNN